MSKQREVIYEPHPVTPERKAELRARGFQIVDAIYAPEGYFHPEAPKRRGRPRKSESGE